MTDAKPMAVEALRASGLIPETHILLPVEVAQKLVWAAEIAEFEMCGQGFGDAGKAAANVLLRHKNEG